MGIFEHYQQRYEKAREEEYSIQEFLDMCKQDKSCYASAAERLLVAIGEPEMIDTSVNPCHSQEPRILTRFLCGIATPLTTRVKAKSLAGFGQLAAHPFAEVLAAVSRIYAATP